MMASLNCRLAFLCLADWSQGDYAQAFSTCARGHAARHRNGSNSLLLGRLHNTLGWFHRELGVLSRAVEYDHESTDIGTHHRSLRMWRSARSLTWVSTTWRLVSMPVPCPILHPPSTVLSVKRLVTTDGGGRCALHWACRAILHHRRRMTKPYAMWKRDSKKRRGPPHRNTSLWAGHCVARLPQNSETATSGHRTATSLLACGTVTEPLAPLSDCLRSRTVVRKHRQGTGRSNPVWQSQSHYRADGNGCRR